MEEHGWSLVFEGEVVVEVLRFVVEKNFDCGDPDLGEGRADYPQTT